MRNADSASSSDALGIAPVKAARYSWAPGFPKIAVDKDLVPRPEALTDEVESGVYNLLGNVGRIGGIDEV